MLVLQRKVGEKIMVGDNIVLTVMDIDRGKMRLAIEAPPEVKIYRGEIWAKVQKEKEQGNGK